MEAKLELLILEVGSKAAVRPDWHSFEDVDVPIHQPSLSHTLDKASYHDLVTRAPDLRSKAIYPSQPSTMLAIG